MNLNSRCRFYFLSVYFERQNGCESQNLFHVLFRREQGSPTRIYTTVSEIKNLFLVSLFPEVINLDISNDIQSMYVVLIQSVIFNSKEFLLT